MEESDKRKPQGTVETEKTPEAPPEFEKQQRFAAVIEKLRGSQPVEPGQGFTARVMASIAEVQSEMTAAASDTKQMKKRAASLLRYLTAAPSMADIALCFLLAGFFYFLLGAILFLGIQNLQPLPATADWLRLQPQVAMITAGVLGTVGLLLLMMASRLVMRVARIATIAFIGFSVFNGVFISLENSGALTSFGLLCFTAAPVLLGLFLAASLHRCRRQAADG